MKKYKVFIFVLLAIQYLSCQREIPFGDLPDYTPQLVVNSELNNQQVISLEVSRSAYAYVNENAEIIENANVALRKGQQEIPLTYNDFFKRFESNEIPGAGETYTVQVSSPGLPAIVATAALPGRLNEKQAEFIIDGGVDNNGNTSDLLTVSFRIMQAKITSIKSTSFITV